jgi:hypothetical protein
VLVSPPPTTRTPNPREHSLDLIQHVADLPPRHSLSS